MYVYVFNDHLLLSHSRDLVRAKLFVRDCCPSSYRYKFGLSPDLDCLFSGNIRIPCWKLVRGSLQCNIRYRR